MKYIEPSLKKYDEETANISKFSQSYNEKMMQDLKILSWSLDRAKWDQHAEQV